MIVAVVGSRAFLELHRVTAFIHALAKKYPEAIVVSGGARGVDRTAENAARRFGLDMISFRPYGMSGEKEFSLETMTHGERAQAIVVERHFRINPPWFRSYHAAAFKRNGWIVEVAERVVAFHVGEPWRAGRMTGSAGTLDTLRKAIGKVPTLRYLPGQAEPEVYDEAVFMREMAKIAPGTCGPATAAYNAFRRQIRAA